MSTVFINFSTYYFYNSPAMHSEGIIEEFGVTSVHIGYLYAVIGVPNLIGVPLGTYIISKLGLGWSVLFFACFTTSGGCVFYLGVLRTNYSMLLLGRALFAAGFDNLTNCQTAVANNWFKGKFLSVALGLNNFVAVAGIASCAFFSPRLYINSGNDLRTPFFVCMALGILTFICSLIYSLLHKKYSHFIDDEEK